MKSGMGSHQSHRMMKDEWITPPDILQSLGVFDLDPCSAINPPFVIAKKTFSILDDGLSKTWFGRVWLNPPYGNQTGVWLDRLATHGNGIALIFARTETEMFVRQVWKRANGLFFIYGRLFFYHVDGQRAKSNSGAPSVLVSYGENNNEILRNCTIPGRFVSLVDF